jgi:hypothetical protein
MRGIRYSGGMQGADLFKKAYYIKLGIIIAALVALLVGGIVLLGRQPAKEASLLPADIRQKISGFTLYFYKNKIPAGYAVDTAHISYANQILMVPLVKSNSPAIVLTEQTLSPNLSDEDIQQNSEQVENAAGKASINQIEARIVGTLVVRSNHTLVILNGPEGTNKEEVKALVQGLEAF